MVNLPFEISFITRVRNLTEDEQKVVAEFAEKIVKSRPDELTLEKVETYNNIINQFVAWAESRQFVFPPNVYPRRYTEREHECIMYKLTRGWHQSTWKYAYNNWLWGGLSPENVVKNVIDAARGNVPDYILELEIKLAIEDIENLIAIGKKPKG